jgi:predicted phosphodiesterase
MRNRKHVLALCIVVCLFSFFTACNGKPAAQEAMPERRSAQGENVAQAQSVTIAPTAEPTVTAAPTPVPTPEPTAFTIAWMSDTQAYTAADSDVFARMTQWVRDTQAEYNTVLTVHTGDIVYNAYREYEWQNGVAAFSNLPENVRIVTCAGNHDELPDYDKNTPYLDMRPDTDFDLAHAFDDKGYNYYTTFTAGGIPIIVFSLAYGMEVDATDWINEVCREYADHYAILAMHNYMFLGGYSSVGERLIERVVKQSPNVRLVLCGHERGMQYMPETLDDDGDGTPDRTVHQMMMNVQDDATNGVGYLRLLRFDPSADTIEVITYSPVLDRYGYEVPVGGDRFGGQKILEDAGLRDFLTPDAT